MAGSAAALPLLCALIIDLTHNALNNVKHAANNGVKHTLMDTGARGAVPFLSCLRSACRAAASALHTYLWPARQSTWKQAQYLAALQALHRWQLAPRQVPR